MQKKLFNELGLSPELLKAVAQMGLEEASHIQSQAIPALLAGSDVVGSRASLSALAWESSHVSRNRTEPEPALTTSSRSRRPIVNDDSAAPSPFDIGVTVFPLVLVLISI